MKVRLLIFFFLGLAVNGLSQDDVLVIDYNNSFTSDQFTNNSRIYNRLVATNTTVTRVASIPGVINLAYDECWIFGDMGAPVAGNLNPVINYINSGGAVYIQSEVNCCNNQAQFTDDIINAVTIIGGSIDHNVTMIGGNYRFIPSPDIFCGSWSNTYGVVVRTFTGVPAGNILYSGTNTCGGSITTTDVIGVRFSACDMISGNGALMSMGDFNTFPSGNCSGAGIVGDPNDFPIIDLISNLFNDLVLCSTCSSPLPIELLSFEGRFKGAINELNWSTSTEINNDFFTLESSFDGINYKEVDRIDGAGNSNELLIYQTKDLFPYKGITYYRLKQTDFNGEYSYSKIISIDTKKENSLSFYPNPSNNNLSIS